MSQDILFFLQENPLFLFVMTGLLGLSIGSFLNVAIYRLPIMLEREFETHLAEATNKPKPHFDEFDLFLPASHCPHCKSPIKWWANIPVLSYLFLRGRSSCCLKPIASRYPLIELLCMILSIYVVYFFGLTWAAVSALFFCWGLLTLIFIDLDKFLLPDDITIPLLWLGLYTNIFNTFANTRSAIIGAIAGYSIFWSIGYLFKRLRGIEGIGQGDYKLLAMLGAWLGWQQLPFIILASSFFGAIYGGIRLFLNRQRQEDPIPFGPFLAIAGLVGLFYGNDIILAYVRWQGFNITKFTVPFVC